MSFCSYYKGKDTSAGSGLVVGWAGGKDTQNHKKEAGMQDNSDMFIGEGCSNS